MYDNENTNKSFLEFSGLVSKYLDELNRKYNNIENNIIEVKVIVEIINSFNVEMILKNKDKLINISSSLEEDINILQFFYDNNAMDTDQVRYTLKSIMNNEIFNRQYDLDKLEKEKDNLENEINKCNKILVDKEYDSELLIYLFDKFKIDEQEQINILSKIIYDSCKGNKRTYENKNVDISKLLERYNRLSEIIKNVVEKYYFLIKGKDEKYINYAKEMCEYIKKSKLDNSQIDIDSNFNYYEESLAVTIISLLEYKKEVDDIVKLVTNNATTQEYSDNIELLLDIIEETIEESKEIIKEYELDNKEKNNSNASNVSILINNEEKVLFDESSFMKEDYKKIVSLIDKLNKGMHDYERGISHTKLQTKYKDYSIFINRTSDMCCAYIRINNEQVLILNFAKLDNIFDSTEQILTKNRDLIKNTVNNITLNDKKTIILQEIIKSSYLQRGVNKQL